MCAGRAPLWQRSEATTGKLVVTELVGSSSFNSDTANAFKFEELQASDGQLLGRVTYEGFARAWPAIEGTGAFAAGVARLVGTDPRVIVSAADALLSDPSAYRAMARGAD